MMRFSNNMCKWSSYSIKRISIPRGIKRCIRSATYAEGRQKGSVPMRSPEH